MSYRLILSDIDGTLLDDNHKLPQQMRTAIQLFHQNGFLFGTASGRTRSNTRLALGDLMDLSCASAYVNGTHIESGEGELLFSTTIIPDLMQPLISQADQINASLLCVSADSAVGIQRHAVCGKSFEMHHKDYALVTDSSKLAVDTNVLVAYAEDIGPLAEFVAQEQQILHCSPVSRSQRTGLEFVFIQDASADKGTALELICAYTGVHLSESVAIGDGIWNDLPMIEKAAVGVVMKNANAALVQAANHVTEKTNHESGAAHFLTGFLGISDPAVLGYENQS